MPGRHLIRRKRLLVVILLVILLAICFCLLESYSILVPTSSKDGDDTPYQIRVPVAGSLHSERQLSDNYTSTHEHVPRLHQGAKSSNSNVGYNEPIRKIILSNLTTIFSEDYIPREYATMAIDSKSTIHFCQIVAKTAYALEVEMFVRSVILHARRSDVFFHFIAAEGAEKSLPKVFNTITSAFVDVRYEIIEVPQLTGYLKDKFENKVTFTHPWSGIYGTGKIFMYDLMPHVNTCIVIDTDTLFGVDPAFLWNEARQHLQPPVTLAATWSPTPEHFNSGVMVHNLARMREIHFQHFINTTRCCKQFRVSGKMTFQCEHDQILLLQMLNDHKELFYLLSVSWNLDKCSSYKGLKFDSFRNDHVYVRDDHVSGFFFGVVHFCCSPTSLKYAYEKGTMYMNKYGLANYFNYLKALDFNRIGKGKVYRVPDK